MNHEVDPVQFGSLLEAVKNLTSDLENHTKELQIVREEIFDLREKYRVGKGALFGLIIGAGFAVKGFWASIEKLIDRI